MTTALSRPSRAGVTEAALFYTFDICKISISYITFTQECWPRSSFLLLIFFSGQKGGSHPRGHEPPLFLLFFIQFSLVLLAPLLFLVPLPFLRCHSLFPICSSFRRFALSGSVRRSQELSLPLPVCFSGGSIHISACFLSRMAENAYLCSRKSN